MSPGAGVVVVGDIVESLGVRPAKEACGAVAAVFTTTFIPSAGCPEALPGPGQPHLCQCNLVTTPRTRAASSPALLPALQKPSPQLQAPIPCPLPGDPGPSKLHTRLLGAAPGPSAFSSRLADKQLGAEPIPPRLGRDVLSSARKALPMGPGSLPFGSPSRGNLGGACCTATDWPRGWRPPGRTSHCRGCHTSS